MSGGKDLYHSKRVPSKTKKGNSLLDEPPPDLYIEYPKGEMEKRISIDDTEWPGIVREISELPQIPQLVKFFSSALEEAKRKFQSEIDHFQDLKVNSEKQDENKIPDYLDLLSKDETCFFELTRVEDSTSEVGYRWALEEFKADGDIRKIILPKFIEEIDEYKIAPNQIQSKVVDSLPLNKSFHIDFMKNSDRRVVGFIKEIEKEEEDFVVMDRADVFKVANKYKNLGKEKVYARIIQWMEKNPEYRTYIFFFILMVQTSNGASLPSRLKY